MAEQSALRVGLVGCGGHGRNLAKAIAETRLLRLVACADPDETAASEAALVTPEASTHSSVEALLAEREVDAIVVATPHHLLGRHIEDRKTAALQELVMQDGAITRKFHPDGHAARKLLLPRDVWVYEKAADIGGERIHVILRLLLGRELVRAVFVARDICAGGGFGSRGAKTYQAPPTTNTAPNAAAPINKSITQPGAPTSAANQATRPGAAATQQASRFGGLRGLLMGGLFAAALAGIFGMGALATFAGFLLQMLLIGGIVYLLFRLFSGGFGVVAWPLRYGDTGVMTFIVSHDGVVYQKDLGPNTAARAAAMTRFDPDPSWQKVDPDK